jgi:tetratricopeptide (TPR) repeat protein
MISARDMFWFALFHAGALAAVALFSGCAGGPMKSLPFMNRGESAETAADRKTRLQTQLGQARMYEQSDRQDKAAEVYQQLIKAYPTQAEPFHRLAVLKDNEKQHGEAQQIYLRAMQLDPTNAQMVNDLGYSYFLSGNLTSAKDQLEQAVAMAPTDKLFRNNLGMTLGHLKMYQPALDQFVAASGEDDAYYNLAFVYSTQNQFEQAKECFHRAMQVNPRHEKSRLALASFERFESSPEMSQEEMLADTKMSGNWQSYKEGGSDNNVQQAGFNESAGGSTAGADGAENLSHNAMSNRQQLHERASTLLQQRMSSMRENTADQRGLSQGFDHGN